jgi:hypothetical protein
MKKEGSEKMDGRGDGRGKRKEYKINVNIEGKKRPRIKKVQRRQ